MTALQARSILDAVAGHALASGWFERVNRHEPKSKNPATDGVTCSIWVQQLTPLGAASGLAVTSTRFEVTVRVYTSMLAEPQDEIDPRVLDAVDGLMGAYNGDFTLGGLVLEVDIFGAYGAPLEAKAGYLNQGGQLYRVLDVRLPLVVADLWPQAE